MIYFKYFCSKRHIESLQKYLTFLLVEDELAKTSPFMSYKWDLDINGAVRKTTLEIMTKESGIARDQNSKRYCCNAQEVCGLPDVKIWKKEAVLRIYNKTSYYLSFFLKLW